MFTEDTMPISISGKRTRIDFDAELAKEYSICSYKDKLAWYLTMEQKKEILMVADKKNKNCENHKPYMESLHWWIQEHKQKKKNDEDILKEALEMVWDDFIEDELAEAKVQPHYRYHSGSVDADGLLLKKHLLVIYGMFCLGFCLYLYLYFKNIKNFKKIKTKQT